MHVQAQPGRDPLLADRGGPVTPVMRSDEPEQQARHAATDRAPD